MSRLLTAAAGPRAIEEPSVGDRPLERAIRVVLAALIAYVPVLVASWGHGPAGWAVVLAAAALLTSLGRVFDAESLAYGLVPAAALTLSGLVQPVSEYMALVTIGLALIARCLIDRRERSIGLFTVAAPRVLVAFVAAYVAWTAVTTVFSTDRRTSVVYLGGIALALGISFWAMPFALGSERARRGFMAVVTMLALAVVGVTVALAITGPQWLYGAPFGSVLMIEPTIFNAPTHLVYPRVFGPYIDQGPYYTLVAVGLIASFALRSFTTGATRVLSTCAAIVLAIALLACYSRASWIMAIAGGTVWTAASLLRRRLDLFSASITVAFGIILVALLLNFLGADTRFDVQASRGWPAWVVAGRLETAQALRALGARERIRGGLSLTQRDGIWAASLAAARHRPVIGSGPGTDAAAIAPYLGPRYALYSGISSHSAWLRTAVEMGVPSLLLLAAIWLAALVSSLAALRRDPKLLGSASVVVLLAWAIAFLSDQTFEVYLFGGLDLPNLLTAFTLSLLAATCVQRAVADQQTVGHSIR